MLNLDHCREIRAVRGLNETDGAVLLDYIDHDTTLPMYSEEEARQMVEDIAEALHGGANLIYWYKDQE